MTTACPSCGTPRMGSFRFCRSCGYDYEPAAPNASTPAPGILTPVPEAAADGPAALSAASGPAPASEAAPPPPAAQPGTAAPAAGSAQPFGAAPAPATAARPIAGGSDGQPTPADDVIAIPVQPLKRAVGALIGGLIGAMLAGAVIVPFLGDSRIFLAVVATVVTISVAALLGVRAVVAITTR